MRSAVVSLVLLAALVAGCGGGGTPPRRHATSAGLNADAYRVPLRVYADAKAASLGARSVRVSGYAPSPTGPVAFDVTFAGPSEAEGTISVKGDPVSLVVSGDTVYFRGNDVFWRHHGGRRVAALLHGRWIKEPKRVPNVGGRLWFFRMKEFFARAFAERPQPGNLENWGLQTYRGRRTVELWEAGPRGGRFYIAAAGKPYPMAIVGKSFKIEFSDWNHPLSVAAPKHAIEPPKQIRSIQA